MNILIIGNGGREHALAWKCAQNTQVKTVYIATGNAGTALESKCQNISIAPTDIEQLATFAKQHVDLTIVGPEAPLVLGIVDVFQAQQLPIFGPRQYAAQLEGSKAFAKDFLMRYGIPTAFYEVFTDSNAAIAYIHEKGAPIVIKADGLAAGKGVVVALTVEEAITAVRDMLEANAFGNAGARIVIEEFLAGEEASFIVMSDGKNVLPMATSQDHKRVGRGDTGANTGGMGAYSPAPVVTEAVFQRVMDQIVNPTLAGMAQEGCPYVGFLYVGLMIDADANPKVIEYNCRFGDPETQPILLRLRSDLVTLIQAACAGQLNKVEAEWDSRPALGVVLAAQYYPQTPRLGDVITGLSHQQNTASVQHKVFVAGAQIENDQIITTGGRVLCVTALGETIQEAHQNAYLEVEKIHWQGMFYRDDIGYRAITRKEN